MGTAGQRLSFGQGEDAPRAPAQRVRSDSRFFSKFGAPNPTDMQPTVGLLIVVTASAARLPVIARHSWEVLGEPTYPRDDSVDASLNISASSVEILASDATSPPPPSTLSRRTDPSINGPIRTYPCRLRRYHRMEWRMAEQRGATAAAEAKVGLAVD